MDHLFYFLSSFKLPSTIDINQHKTHIYTDYSPATDETSNKPTTEPEPEPTPDIEGGMIKCCEESKCCNDWRTNMPECQKCAGNCCEKFKIPRNSDDCFIETLLCQPL